jgi:hypothetical protein
MNTVAAATKRTKRHGHMAELLADADAAAVAPLVLTLSIAGR